MISLFQPQVTKTIIKIYVKKTGFAQQKSNDNESDSDDLSDNDDTINEDDWN